MAEREKTGRLVDEMFRDLEAKGVRALAYSNEEKVRVELLGFMQTLANYKLKIHAALQESGIEKVLVNNAEDITEDMIASLGPKSQIIELKQEKDDEST